MSKLDDSGFTLLETLVAVVVLSVTITVLMQVFSSGLRAVGSGDLHFQAVRYAKAKMEEVLVFNSLLPNEVSGRINDTFSYRLAITKEKIQESEAGDAAKNVAPAKESPSGPLFDLFRIELTILWDQEQKSFVLTTLKAVQK